jgi:hypothetical protein
MAALGIDEYRSRFLEQLGDIEPDCPVAVDDRQVRRVYRWDDIEVARFKFLVNFVVRDAVRERIIDDIFVERLGDEQAFARELYLDWADAREMQDAGMLIGGHSHGHAALSRMETEERRTDLSRCVMLLREALKPQPLWPFSYPFGDVDEATRALVHELGFTCAFTTQVGANAIGSDPFLLRRIDPKDVPVQEPCISSH